MLSHLIEFFQIKTIESYTAAGCGLQACKIIFTRHFKIKIQAQSPLTS